MTDTTQTAVAAWFGERLPSEWTATTPQVTVDREEIIVILTVPAPERAAAESTGPEQSQPEPTEPEPTEPEPTEAEPTEPEPTEAEPTEPEPTEPEPTEPEPTAAAKAEAIAGRIARFREETRDHRIAIAREAEHRFGRKVAWGVESAGTQQVFTSLAIPVMTRLRQSERLVLDTLVDAGVARSRAHALAWCVRLVGDNAGTWLTDLRSAMAEVEKVRDAGPGTAAG